MSTITKEWLQQTIAEYEANRDELPFGLDTNSAIELQAFKLALASLEAKSRKLFTCSGCGAEGLDEPLESKCHCNEDGAHWVEGVVYTAPPAPVSVPDELAGKSFEYIANKFQVSISEAQWILVGWNACRAAMLQGAEPVTTAYKLPDGWVACSERMPEGMTDVHISNGHDVGQGWWDGDAWQTQHDYYSVTGEVTHWQPLPSPPAK